MTTIGIVFAPTQPPERLRAIALATEAAELEELWLWEDCFAESGLAPAAAVLAWTDRIGVGIGLLPVPLRNVALCAMEIATLARLFPGRLRPGLGHGVLDWMGQAGVRAQSPTTLLREYSTALRSLLEGQTVTTSGDYVRLDDVRLAYPPASVPPLLIGATKPKTLAIAGELGDGVLLAGGEATPDEVRESMRVAIEARRARGIDTPFEVSTNVMVPVDARADDIEKAVRPYVSVGVTRVTICGVDADGTPDGSDRVLRLVDAVAQVRLRFE
ncbi:LLM class flavin-dependent oxidoreductase [Mycobacterium sp. 21AC1]|uniref:LLM class flavin-dependent oxidoreductase n=1 Tax=[Mycobacterium] appelbergii TaxID=2939269 RepID=UPI0029392738|nr:LLM class flavin-dependent oxidoreductase [Mycobacterium sp. 21AC1]MDV3123568.1 LLM class flavin-dependent oxidoreductase [Mycobacterium sp. 21AC1]